jgi:hypothetical protein
MAKQVRQFKGIWFPAKLWQNTELTWMEKLMFMEIDSLCGDDGCYASNKYLAGFFQLSASRVSEIISGLNEKKYIRIEYERDGKQIKKRTIWVVEKPDGGIRDSGEGYSENRIGVFGKGEREITNKEIPNRENKDIAPTASPDEPAKQKVEKPKRPDEERSAHAELWSVFETALGCKIAGKDATLEAKSIWELIDRKKDGNGGLTELKEIVKKFIEFTKEPPDGLEYLGKCLPLPHILNSTRTWLNVTAKEVHVDRLPTKEETKALVAAVCEKYKIGGRK